MKLSRIGGIQWPSIETEGVWIITSKGEKIRRSVLIDTASGHIFGAEGSKTPRDDEHMEVRLDAYTTSATQTRELGINIGDCAAFDPRVEVTNGFIRMSLPMRLFKLNQCCRELQRLAFYHPVTVITTDTDVNNSNEFTSILTSVADNTFSLASELQLGKQTALF